MKNSDLKLGVDYAVIPAWSYSSKDKKDPNRVERRDVAKATLVSLDKYEYKVHRTDDVNDVNFLPAPKGSRVVGYKVKSNDFINNQDTYWLARPQDIVAEFAPLELRWHKEEIERAEQERKQREEHERLERIRREAEDRERRILQGVKDSLTLIIGAERVEKVQFDVTTRRNSSGDYAPYGQVLFDSRIAQLLVEKVLEAKDLVG